MHLCWNTRPICIGFSQVSCYNLVRKGVIEMATGITVDSKGVVIPVEMLNAQGESLVVLTLARGAYLIMRSEMLAAYPRQRLLEFSRTAPVLEHSRPKEGITFTPRKQRALRELSQQGYLVSDGLGYGLQAMANPEVTLEEVWQGLARMEGSLAQEVLAEREER